MSRTDVYERILNELADGELDELEVKVFHFLRRVYPAPLTRYDLLECIFGYRPAEDENLNNNTDDRKIRTAIASMFEKGVPIVSTSGGAGYRIDIDLEQWNEVAKELESKKATFQKKVSAAYRIIRTIRKYGVNAIPSNVPQVRVTMSDAQAPETPVQLSFMGDQ